MNKITLATIKSFIKREIKNNNLFIKQNSNFDGRVDCVMPTEGGFEKQNPKDLNMESKNNLGLKGIWMVGSSRDYYQPFSDENFIGYSISNCCGDSIVAMKRLY